MRPHVGRRVFRVSAVLALTVWVGGSAANAQDGTVVEQPPVQEEADVEPDSTNGGALQGQAMGPLEARTVALLLSGQTGGRVGGAVLWSVLPGDDGGRDLRVPVFIDVDGPSLLAEDPLGRLGISVHAYVLSQDGGVVDHLSEGYALDGALWGEKIRGRGLKYGVTFELDPGRYGLRVLVRNHRTGRVFLSADELVVPDPDATWPEMLPPVFAEPQTAWVEAAAPTMEYGPRFAVGEEEILPAALPVVVAGEPAAMVVVVRGDWEATRLVARISDRRGQVVAEPRVEVDSVLRTWRELRYVKTTLEPTSLPQGRYELELEYGDGESGSAVTRSENIVVVRSLGRAEAPVMTGGAPTAVDDGSGIGNAGGDVPQVTDEGEMRQRYIAALELLVRGEDQAALQAVADLERAAWAGGSNSGLNALRKIEDRVAGEVLAGDAAALAPLVLLHRNMHRFYTVHGDGVLADISWRRAAALAGEMAAASEAGSENRGMASDLVLRIATDLLRESSVGAGRNMLAQTLEIAPANRDALLSLAALHERLGEYEEAVEPLRHSVREHPECSECQLRLAINLVRLDETAEAEATLRHLSELERPRWIAILACQELGRLLSRTGRLAEAEALLQDANDRYSDDTLVVQMAWVLVRQGRRWEASELLGRLRSGSGDDADAPRVRYTRWPGLGLESRWRRVVGLAEEARRSLGTILSGLPVQQEVSS